MSARSYLASRSSYIVSHPTFLNVLIILTIIFVISDAVLIMSLI